MKRFKELRENFMVESEFSPYGLSNRSIHTDDGTHRLDNTENLGRINAFIENFLSSNTLHAKAKLEQLKIRLNHIGLDFDVRGGLVDENVTSYPVSYYGKVFGYKMENGVATGEIGDQDLATEKFGKPLALSVRQTGEGVVQLEAKIHFVGEEEGLGEDALELRLHIDNDEVIFESKILPAIENAEDIDEALRGLMYAVRSAVKGYEMDVSDDDIQAVAESILMDTLDPEEDEDDEDLLEVEVELDELDKSTVQNYERKAKIGYDIAKDMSKHEPHKDDRDEMKRVAKRRAMGMARASARTEEVDQVDELKLPKNPNNSKIRDAKLRGADRAAKRSDDAHTRSMGALQRGDYKGSENQMDKSGRAMDRVVKRTK